MAVFKRSGKPFFPVGGQSHNSSGYCAEDLDKAMGVLAMLDANTITVPVYWEQVEPEEGRFEFDHVRAIIARVAQYGLALIIDWFGTWKNGSCKYVPAWVKENGGRFRRVIDANGREINVLSSHCEANCAADSAAFAALMRTLAEIDPNGDTVIGVQVENETGIYPGSARDFSREAEAEWQAEIPRELVQLMENHPAGDITACWERNGRKTDSWPHAFGVRAAAEYFTAWSISGYVDSVAAAGRKYYATTLFVNVWIQQKGWRISGLDYPAGGPVNRVLEIWKLRTPHIDMISPDIYLQTAQEYDECIRAYIRGDNPLFIPEAGREEWHSRLMAEAVGTYRSQGYIFFGVESMVNEQGAIEPASAAMGGTLQAMSAVAGALLHNPDWPLVTINQDEYAESQYMEFDNFLAVAFFINCQSHFNDADWNFHDHRHPDYRKRLADTDARGRGWVMQAGPAEFIVAGDGFRMQFFPKSALDDRVSPLMAKEGLVGRSTAYVSVEEGRFSMDGEYIPTRKRNGDESDFGVWTEPDCGAIRVKLIR